MEEDTKETKLKAKEFFQKHKFVSSPAFPEEKISFNSKALSHLFYKGANKKSSRPLKESAIRVNLLGSALKVLAIMPLSQEENTLVDPQGKVTIYWAFEAVIDQRRIKVIVRQVGKGQKHFWSVIPAWRRIKGVVINSKGKLGDD